MPPSCGKRTTPHSVDSRPKFPKLKEVEPWSLNMNEQLRALYRCRRERLGELAGKNAAVIVPSETTLSRGGRDFPFAQDKSFLYLTGLNEPDACLVVKNTDEGIRSILFCPPHDKDSELWHGPHLIPEDAVEELGVDGAFANVPEVIGFMWATKRLRLPKKIYYPKKRAAEACLRQHLLPIKRVAQHRSTRCRFLDNAPLTAQMRLVKDEHEVAIMRRAAHISANVHRSMLHVVRPGMTEYELEAEIAMRFRKAGGSALHAYQSIVAGGKNACILHYVKNSEVLRSGDLCLVDAGCELEGYASDITRTFPVNGTFSPAQRAIYEIVLRGQKKAIEYARPGGWLAYCDDVARMEICEGLMELGVIKKQGILDATFRQKVTTPFYPHHIGHWLGLDVHDVDPSDHLKDETKRKGQYRKRPFTPGMVITVEPGIYIRPHQDITPKYWNIGVRIEDDALITENGNEVLSKDAPKEADEIEEFMRPRV